MYFESSSNQATMSIPHSFLQTLTCCVWGLVYQRTDVPRPCVLLGFSTECILSAHINKGGSSLLRQIQMVTSFGNPLRDSSQNNVWPGNTRCSQADTFCHRPVSFLNVGLVTGIKLLPSTPSITVLRDATTESQQKHFSVNSLSTCAESWYKPWKL